MNFVKKHPLLTAFLIPFFICIIICIGNGVYPFGDYCLLHMDLYHQYLPFFNELWEKLRNGASLMYTWNIGLGGICLLSGESVKLACGAFSKEPYY